MCTLVAPHQAVSRLPRAALRIGGDAAGHVAHSNWRNRETGHSDSNLRQACRVCSFILVSAAAASQRIPRSKQWSLRRGHCSRSGRVSVLCAGREGQEALKTRMERLEALKPAASSGNVFSEAELDSAVKSLRLAADDFAGTLDWSQLRSCLAASAHEPYKDWVKTEQSADALCGAFMKPSSSEFRYVFQRVFKDGCWESAAQAAEHRVPDAKPWVVLVTGLNGIRKTTCMYQPWFKEVLQDAIKESSGEEVAVDDLPDGNNSFFRQLDHIIATVANEEFRTLYTVSDVDRYSALKDGIFARYRKIAEMWGILLIKEAKQNALNVMVETSGRDPGMFHYIDYCFPDDSYRKLVLHFEINDIGFAERSVDSRMLGEMAAGQNALVGTVEDIIAVNSGGPYGSKVLQGVQKDSNRVWEQVVAGTLAESWYKASISITAQEDAEWTARATSEDLEKKAYPIERR